MYIWYLPYEQLKVSQTTVNWRLESKKVMLVIGDSIPHPKNFHLNKEQIDWEVELERLRDMVC